MEKRYLDGSLFASEILKDARDAAFISAGHPDTNEAHGVFPWGHHAEKGFCGIIFAFNILALKTKINGDKNHRISVKYTITVLKAWSTALEEVGEDIPARLTESIAELEKVLAEDGDMYRIVS